MKNCKRYECPIRRIKRAIGWMLIASPWVAGGIYASIQDWRCMLYVVGIPLVAIGIVSLGIWLVCED